VLSWAQAKPATKPTAPHAAASSGEPTAVFDTTAGKLTCKLFEKETPTTVANFISLAQGTKDWKNPISHATKHNVPLYDGTIFHRVIPNFMIQGGDPAGNGSGDPGNDRPFRSVKINHIKIERGTPAAKPATASKPAVKKAAPKTATPK